MRHETKAARFRPREGHRDARRLEASRAAPPRARGAIPASDARRSAASRAPSPLGVLALLGLLDLLERG